MVEGLVVKFSDNIDNKYDKEPTPPYIIVENVGEEDPSLEDSIQKRYQQGVGSLMYLVKHSLPDISNPVREISKGLKRENNSHLKSIHSMISFVVNTKERGLLIKPLMDGEMYWKMEILVTVIGIQIDKLGRVLMVGQYFSVVH